jgi:hypothetical protein
MSLRLLSGPTIITNAEGVSPQYYFSVLWYTGLGLLADVEFACTGVVTLDGIWQSYSGQRPPQLVSWWAAKERMLTSGGLIPTVEYVYEPKALSRQTTGPDLITGIFPRTYVRLEDRRLAEADFRLEGIVDGVGTLEGPTFPFLISSIVAGRSKTEVFVSTARFSADTKCCFYDTVNRVISSPIMHLGMDCEFICYAPEFGVIVTTHIATVDDAYQYSLRVWSLEVQPDSLSDVEVVAGEVRSGQVVTYRVRLLGDMNDPCAGELINWTLTGTGTLKAIQSVTDAAGYATVQVMYSVGESGDSTVEASVEC